MAAENSFSITAILARRDDENLLGWRNRLKRLSVEALTPQEAMSRDQMVAIADFHLNEQRRWKKAREA